MRAGSNQRNRSLRCDYHRDHGHETNHCQSLKFLVEKLIRAGHLRRYLREPTHGASVAPTADRAIAEIEHAPEPRPTINFILGGPADSQYQSKKQRRRMLRTASVRARVNTISNQGDVPAVLPVDGPISFPPINPTRVITPHYDALVLTVCINSFDVHRVLVDPSSATDLLHLPAFKQMRVPIDHLHSGQGFVRFQRSYHTVSRGHHLLYQGRSGNPASIVFRGRRLGAIQCYPGSSMAACHESSTIHVSPNNKLSN